MVLDIDPLLAFAREITEEAATYIKSEREAGKPQFDKKSSKDLVTETDLKAEELLIGRIKERYSDHIILSEETSPELGSADDFLEPLWIIDPIDGTTNYAYGLHYTAVAVAFAVGGIVTAGVVNAPFLNEEFYASLNQGAFLNGQKIEADLSTEMPDAVIVLGRPPFTRQDSNYYAQVESVGKACMDIRRSGCAALDICNVAAGRTQGFYESIKPWDIAAGGLIAREAGARTGHLLPLPEDTPIPEQIYAGHFLVGAPKVYEDLKDVLSSS